MRTHKNTFPVNLLLENKKCLIVGGGRVAARKLKKLLDVNAKVTVVCTQKSEYINHFSKEVNLTLKEKEFSEDDLLGIYLTFTATDNYKLNEQIIELCKQKNILCCAVDANWKNADFLTPAYFNYEDILFSIASGGKSCTTTRLVKETLLELFNLSDKKKAYNQENYEKDIISCYEKLINTIKSGNEK